MMNSKIASETSFIRKYYNPLATFDHRRIWPQNENQKRELVEENQRAQKNPLVGMQLAFLADKKLLKKFLVKVQLHQAK